MGQAPEGRNDREQKLHDENQWQVLACHLVHAFAGRRGLPAEHAEVPEHLLG